MPDPLVERYPTRQYSYRERRLDLEADDAGAAPGTPVPLAPDTLYGFVKGLDAVPAPLPAAGLAGLRDPFAELLLKRGVFPLTLPALLQALDARNADPEGVPDQQVF